MWLPVGVNRCQKFSDMLTYTACASVCLKCDKDFYFPAPEEKKGTSKMEHLFFFQRRVQIPVQKCFWILFPSLSFIVGEYKEWAWTFGWIRDGNVSFSVSVSWDSVCQRRTSLLSLKGDSPLHTCKCVFIFNSSNRLKIFPHQRTWTPPPGFVHVRCFLRRCRRGWLRLSRIISLSRVIFDSWLLLNVCKRWEWYCRNIFRAP